MRYINLRLTYLLTYLLTYPRIAPEKYVLVYNGSFHFLDQSFAETKDRDQTAQLWTQSGVEINQSPSSVIADVIGDSSLISPHFFVYLWTSEKVMFVYQRLICNRLVADDATCFFHRSKYNNLLFFTVLPSLSVNKDNICNG